MGIFEVFSIFVATSEMTGNRLAMESGWTGQHSDGQTCLVGGLEHELSIYYGKDYPHIMESFPIF